MSAPAPKATLQRYLDRSRDQLLAILDGLGEHDVRRPMTATATNLLGVVKHVASVELGYFGETFDRPPGIALPWIDDEDAEINADMWATAVESRDQIVELHRAAGHQADSTINELDLDSPGRVPWWPAERADVTLHQILVHMVVERAQHLGHAQIIRELILGRPDVDPNLADLTPEQWAAYRARVQQAADHFGPS